MGKFKTTADFIKEAEKVHGKGTYDYSLVEFKKVTDEIEIICPKHGKFKQGLRYHLRGQGCPQCGIEKRAKSKSDTRESFIEKAIKVHHDENGKPLYDYSKVIYTKSSNKVIITCPIHGDFEQKANSHLNGKGCPKCGDLKKKEAAKKPRGESKRKYKKEDFIRRSKEVWGDEFKKFDFSKLEFDDIRSMGTLICKKHGEYRQYLTNHLSHVDCPKCNEEFLKKEREKRFFEKLHNTFKDENGNFIYDDRHAVYNGYDSDIELICPIHGKFIQKASYLLNGYGCQKCGVERMKQTIRMPFEEVIRRAIESHKNEDGTPMYDYSLTTEENVYNDKKIIAICPKHGVFEQSVHNHLEGCKCPKCALEEKCLTQEQFLEKAKKVHGDKYDFSKSVYTKSEAPIIVTCPIHGDFTTTPHRLLRGAGCPTCGRTLSKGEDEVSEFVKSLGFDIEKRNIKILNGYKELDIYIPSKMIAIEYNGLYWHSELFRDDKYHLNKMLECQEKGIRLIQIFEDEWLNKKEIVKSRIESILGISKNKIYARNCEIREVRIDKTRQFLDENHLQGYCNASVRYGLYYNNELVSLMTFGGLRKNLGSTSEEGSFELLRFCNKLNYQVVGGASKLLKHFIENIKPHRIISYCDLRYSDGKLYKSIGFELVGQSKPNYYYIDKGFHNRENRYNYRKDILVEKYHCPKDISEHKFCNSMGLYRIYDCGNLKFELTC